MKCIELKILERKYRLRINYKINEIYFSCFIKNNCKLTRSEFPSGIPRKQIRIYSFTNRNQLKNENE